MGIEIGFVSSICPERENDDVEKTGLNKRPRDDSDKTRHVETRPGKTGLVRVPFRSSRCKPTNPFQNQ